MDFNEVYQRRLVPEQRKAILEVIAKDLTPDTTLGEVVDAAEEIGWDAQLGELCLAELAQALELGQGQISPSAYRDEEFEEEVAEEEESEEVEEEEEIIATPKRRKKTKTKGRASTASKATAKTRKAQKKPVKAKKSTNKQKTSSRGKKHEITKKSGKKPKASQVEEDLDVDLLHNAMSLDQAMELLVPIINKCKQATMQELEEKTGLGRRKLRFHIGQLVKHNLLERHGMGRGTYYTVC